MATATGPAPAQTLQTSLVELVSTLHSRGRRRQRDITKRDLKAAVKHGAKAPGNALALMAPVSDAATQLHCEISAIVKKQLRSCTSHFVLVVDQSGSMKKGDVPGYTNRHAAVFGTLALDVVGRAIDTKLFGGSVSDVVTIIDMCTEPVHWVQREPITNVLYNKLVERQGQPPRGGQGYFVKALQMAEKVLQQDLSKGSDRCALTLMFLSDGRPSDQQCLNKRCTGERGTPQNMQQAILDATEGMYQNCGPRLKACFVGFAENSPTQFTMMQMMAEAAKPFGTQAYFEHSITAESLSSLVSTLVSSHSSTRIQLTNVAAAVDDSFKGGPDLGPKLDHAKAEHPGQPRMQIDPRTDPFDVFLHTKAAGGVKIKSFTTMHKGSFCNPSGQTFQSPGAIGIAVARKPFGEGAERIVYEFYEVGPAKKGVHPCLGRPMVAKESCRQIASSEGKIDFHACFVRTQQQASHFAEIFNEQLKFELESRDLPINALPMTSFLQCHVYTIEHCGKGRFKKPKVGYLVEPDLMAGVQNHFWNKWNSNNGDIDGSTKILGDVNVLSSLFASDVPQAFSHWTYHHDRNKRLVCDLQ
eukprot:gene930-2580_t